MTVFFNNQYLPKTQVRISPDDRAFLFADGVYEVTRAYNGHLFQLNAHLARLDRSLQELQIAKPDVDFKTVSQELLAKNNLDQTDACVYIQVSRGAAPRKHAFPDPGTPPTVYAYAYPFKPDPKHLANGISTITVADLRWARCDIKSIALLPNCLARQQAREKGAEEALFVRDGAIIEGTHTSFCAVFGDTLHTHPDSPYLLPGVTRSVALDLCDELGIPVQQFPILEHQLKEADEFLVLGTTSDITPVVRVNDWQVKNGKPGPITLKLQTAYRHLYESYI